MSMMRAAVLLLLLVVNESNAIRGGVNRKNDKSRRELSGGEGPCGSISPELQAFWSISDAACAQANEQRADNCVIGPVATSTGTCETTEECLNPLESCIIVRDLNSTAFYTTVCGTVDGVALEYEIQTYSIKEICADENVA